MPGMPGRKNARPGGENRLAGSSRGKALSGQREIKTYCLLTIITRPSTLARTDGQNKGGTMRKLSIISGHP